MVDGDDIWNRKLFEEAAIPAWLKRATRHVLAAAVASATLVWAWLSIKGWHAYFLAAKLTGIPAWLVLFELAIFVLATLLLAAWFGIRGGRFPVAWSAFTTAMLCMVLLGNPEKILRLGSEYARAFRFEFGLASAILLINLFFGAWRVLRPQDFEARKPKALDTTE